jgi:N-acetylated-alpha-linked acidic dipeptidase
VRQVVVVPNFQLKMKDGSQGQDSWPLLGEKDDSMVRRSRLANRRQSCLTVANAVVVSIIVFYMVLMISRSMHCPHVLSEDEAEHVMLNSPSPGFIRHQSGIYTSGPHLAGKNYTQAVYTRDLWESYGIKSEIEEYEVLLNYPISHRLALYHDTTLEYEAELREDPIPEDPTSADPDVVPTFHGYSANGSATGELIYANFGHIDDFRLLEKSGVNVSGTVVIVRYGSTFRGLKVKAAQGIAGAI